MLADDDIFKAITFRCQKCRGNPVRSFRVDRCGGDFSVLLYCHGDAMAWIFSEEYIARILERPEMKVTALAFHEKHRLLTEAMIELVQVTEPDVASLIWQNRDN